MLETKYPSGTVFLTKSGFTAITVPNLWNQWTRSLFRGEVRQDTGKETRGDESYSGRLPNIPSNVSNSVFVLQDRPPAIQISEMTFIWPLERLSVQRMLSSVKSHTGQNLGTFFTSSLLVFIYVNNPGETSCLLSLQYRVGRSLSPSGV